MSRRNAEQSVSISDWTKWTRLACQPRWHFRYAQAAVVDELREDLLIENKPVGNHLEVDGFQRVAAVSAVPGVIFGKSLIERDVFEPRQRPVRDVLPPRHALPNRVLAEQARSQHHIGTASCSGRYRYTERGILDKTHVRFITRNSLRVFLKHLGPLSIVQESVSVPPAEFVLPQRILHNPLFRTISMLHYHAALALPGLLGYQLLTRLHHRG
jgi:hypothetical protein